jgi:hypothetical protein
MISMKAEHACRDARKTSQRYPRVRGCGRLHCRTLINHHQKKTTSLQRRASSTRLGVIPNKIANVVIRAPPVRSLEDRRDFFCPFRSKSIPGHADTMTAVLSPMDINAMPKNFRNSRIAHHRLRGFDRSCWRRSVLPP